MGSIKSSANFCPHSILAFPDLSLPGGDGEGTVRFVADAEHTDGSAGQGNRLHLVPRRNLSKGKGCEKKKGKRAKNRFHEKWKRMFLLQSYGEGIRTLGGDREVLTDPVDQGRDQHGISPGFRSVAD